MMDREDFVGLVYSELASDPDNCRANRIIEAADEYAESAQLGMNLAEVGTDCISRHAAIADAKSWIAVNGFEQNLQNKVIEWLKEFPPAQPEPCEDAVSRKAAIAQMQGLTKWNGIIADSCVDFEDVISVLENKENLPPVTPKQRTGKWIDGIIPNDSGGLPVIVCDQCNTFFPLQFGDGHNFCPNCGAKMEGDAE